MYTRLQVKKNYMKNENNKLFLSCYSDQLTAPTQKES